MSPAIAATRAQILAFRRRTQALDERLPDRAESLRQALWAGAQDSMPRAAVLSIHARITGTTPTVLQDPRLVQVWGPRFNVFVVDQRDVALFTIALHPEQPRPRRRAEEMADAVAAVVGQRELPDRQVAAALGVGNAIRYATTTGRVLIRWDGARAPVVRMAPAPDVGPAQARRELAQRYLHTYGPTTAEAFSRWAGVPARAARTTFDASAADLVVVATPIGEQFLPAEDEDTLRAPTRPPAPARLLPSGDAFFLLYDRDRELLVPDEAQRARLWTSRVWPGALVIGGEVTGTWRRAGRHLTVEPWRPLAPAERAAVEAEAAALPLPGLTAAIDVRWSG
jgi:hypothetical protein